MPSTVQEVFDILSNAPDPARWWPAVYLDVQELAPGDERGVGKIVSLYTTGWWPYTLRWRFRVTAAGIPRTFTLEAWAILWDGASGRWSRLDRG